jgi:hypothetical protein
LSGRVTQSTGHHVVELSVQLFKPRVGPFRFIQTLGPYGIPGYAPDLMSGISNCFVQDPGAESLQSQLRVRPTSRGGRFPLPGWPRTGLRHPDKHFVLRHNPAVALTIDTEVHPPKMLLIRGRAELDVVDGIPDEYLKMNGTYTMTPQQREAWEAEVRSLYDGMVRIVVTPIWAKLIDFETTLPSAVEELVRQREERQRT